MSSVISSNIRPPFLEHQEDSPAVEVTDDDQEARQPSAMNLSTPRSRSPDLLEYSDSNVSSVIRLGSSKPDYSSSTPVIKTHDSSASSRSHDPVPPLKSHDSASGAVSMMMPPGLQHMQHLIQQHLSPAQFQSFFQQQGLLMQQQHNQLAELNKKQLEEAVRQLQEQLQVLMYQQSQAQHDKSKSAALSLHQSQLMQQLQLLQQRYLLQQAGMSQSGPTPGATTSEAAPWDAMQERHSNVSPPPVSRHSPPSSNGLAISTPTPTPTVTNGRRELREDLRSELRNGGLADDERADEEDLIAKTSPLYCNGVCNWPGCDCPCEDLQAFLKHLNTEHVLDDRSAAHARVQVQVVQLFESNLAKEKARLAAMMAHFRMAREKMAEPPPPEPPIVSSHTPVPPPVVPTPPATSQSGQLLSGHPFLRSAILQGPTASTAGPVRRRVNDRSMTPGPYEEPPTQTRRRPADRAGQDITEELSRNRDFYRTTDIRPPFTYASLIRQGIIESPEKQLTLNEIYSWFQSTFAYFRRNAATWKNAVRHNLSLHKCFTRVENVKGAVWTVDEVEFCKRRSQRSAGQARSPTLSCSPTLYGDALTAGLQSALVDSNLPFMHTAADRLREMRERDAPTLLGLQRRSPSPLRTLQPSRSPEAIVVPKLEYDVPPHTPEVEAHHDKSRDVISGPPENNDAEDLSMPAVKMEYSDTTQSVAEPASA